MCCFSRLGLRLVVSCHFIGYLTSCIQAAFLLNIRNSVIFDQKVWKGFEQNQLLVTKSG